MIGVEPLSCIAGFVVEMVGQNWIHSNLWERLVECFADNILVPEFVTCDVFLACLLGTNSMMVEL